MNATQIKNFFNSSFFADGEEKATHMVVSFETAEGKQCKIPGIEFYQSTTIGQIFHAYHEFLKENNSQEVVEENAEAEAIVDQVVQVVYRDNDYMVQLYSDGSCKIRKSNGEFLNVSSPTGKAILKQAKESSQT